MNGDRNDRNGNNQRDRYEHFTPGRYTGPKEGFGLNDVLKEEKATRE